MEDSGDRLTRVSGFRSRSASYNDVVIQALNIDVSPGSLGHEKESEEMIRSRTPKPRTMVSRPARQASNDFRRPADVDFKAWLTEQVQFSQTLKVPGRNQAPREGGILRALSRLGARKARCSFSMYVHGADSLPSEAEGKGLEVQWERKGMAVGTNASTVRDGMARIEQSLQLCCTMFFTLGAHASIKCQPKHSIVYIRLVGGDRPLILAQETVDLAAIMPTSLGDAAARAATVRFPLPGRTGVVIVTFGYEIEVAPGNVKVARADTHAFKSVSPPSSRESSPASTSPDWNEKSDEKDLPNADSRPPPRPPPDASGAASFQLPPIPQPPIPATDREGGGNAPKSLSWSMNLPRYLDPMSPVPEEEEERDPVDLPQAGSRNARSRLSAPGQAAGLATAPNGSEEGGESEDEDDVQVKEVLLGGVAAGRSPVVDAPESSRGSSMSERMAQAVREFGSSSAEDRPADVPLPDYMRATAAQVQLSGAPLAPEVDSLGPPSPPDSLPAWRLQSSSVERATDARAAPPVQPLGIAASHQAEPSPDTPSVRGAGGEVSGVSAAPGLEVETEPILKAVVDEPLPAPELFGCAPAPFGKGAVPGPGPGAGTEGVSERRGHIIEDPFAVLLKCQPLWSSAGALKPKGQSQPLAPDSGAADDGGEEGRPAHLPREGASGELLDAFVANQGLAGDSRAWLQGVGGDDAWSEGAVDEVASGDGAGSDEYLSELIELMEAEELGAGEGAEAVEEGEGEEEVEEGEGSEDAEALTSLLHEVEGEHQRAGIAQQSRLRVRQMLEQEENAARRMKVQLGRQQKQQQQHEHQPQQQQQQEEQQHSPFSGEDEDGLGTTAEALMLSPAFDPSEAILEGGPQTQGGTASLHAPGRQDSDPQGAMEAPAASIPQEGSSSGVQRQPQSSATPAREAPYAVAAARPRGAVDCGERKLAAVQGRGLPAMVQAPSAAGRAAACRGGRGLVKQRVSELEDWQGEGKGPQDASIVAPRALGAQSTGMAVGAQGNSGALVPVGRPTRKIHLDSGSISAVAGMGGLLPHPRELLGVGISLAKPPGEPAGLHGERESNRARGRAEGRVAAVTGAPKSPAPPVVPGGGGSRVHSAREIVPSRGLGLAPRQPTGAAAAQVGPGGVRRGSEGGVGSWEGFDLRQLMPGAADPLALAAPEGFAPPALFAGLGSAIATAQGGLLASMSGKHFAEGTQRLVMQFSRPVVVPVEMGRDASEVMRSMALALGAAGDLSDRMQQLMPLPDLSGRPLEQIAAEGLLYLEAAHAAADGAACAALSGSAQARLGAAGLGPRAAIQAQAEQTALVPQGSRHLATKEVPEGLQLAASHWPDWLGELEQQGSSLCSALARLNRRGGSGPTSLHVGGAVEGLVGVMPGMDSLEEVVTLNELAPLAVDQLEALALEGLLIQNEASGLLPPDAIQLLPGAARPMRGQTRANLGVGSARAAAELAGTPPGLALAGVEARKMLTAAPLGPGTAGLDLVEWAGPGALDPAGGEERMPEDADADEMLGVLAAHQAFHGPSAAVSRALGEGGLIAPQGSRAGLQPLRPHGGVLAAARLGQVAGQPEGEAPVTIAMLVQLRDPLRNFEPVGAPMVALLQAEGVADEPSPASAGLGLGYAPQLALPSNTDGEASGLPVVGAGVVAHHHPTEGAKGRQAPAAGEGSANSGAAGAANAAGRAGTKQAKFRLVGVHMMGLKTEEGSKRSWGTARATQAGSRWVAAQGMGKKDGAFGRARRPPSVSDPKPRKPGAAQVTVRPGDTMWSLTQKVHGSGAKWKDVAKLNPHIRNPDLIIPNQKLRMA